MCFAEKPLVIHEWGTITTHHRADGTPEGRLNRIDDSEVLPLFVHKFEPEQTSSDSNHNSGKSQLVPGRPDVIMRLCAHSYG